MITQALGAVRIYDDFTAGAVDPERWTVLELPRTGGRRWRCEDPAARTVVGEGTLDIHIERFTRHHDRVQIFDNLKHQLVAARPFETPASGGLSFSVEIAATNLGSALGDWRDGQATLTVFDPATGWSFRAFTTSHHVFASHEAMRADATTSPRSIIDCGRSPITVHPGVSHQHDVTLDVDRNTITWCVDGVVACELSDCELPSELDLALGISSLQPIVDRCSQSVHGQGLSASFGPLLVATTS